MDGAAATDRGKHESNDGSPCCGVSYHPSKLKANSKRLQGVSATSFMASSIVGGSDRIWRYDILWWVVVY